MKRETREWIGQGVGGAWLDESERKDVLDSDAKQRAEIRDLKARLKAVDALTDRHINVSGGGEHITALWTALDLKNKNWRKR